MNFPDVLVTGFSSFPGAPRNPTGELIRRLKERTEDGGGAVAAELLPVEWDRCWPQLEAAIMDRRPRTVLMFGLSQRAERLRLELGARNRRELGRVDAAGAYPSGPAVLDGPEILPGRMDWTCVASALRGADVPFEWSSNAGGYLCNDTYYRLAFHAARLEVDSFGFFHVPLTDRAVAETFVGGTLPDAFCTISEDILDRAVMTLLEACSR